MTMDPPTPEVHPHELLADYVSGSLEATRHEEVEQHLASCTACREDVALARRARAALAALSELEVPDGVARRVVDAASRRDGRRRGRGRSRLARTTGTSAHRSSRGARVTLALGAAAAAAVIVVFAWSAVRGGAPVHEAAAPSVKESTSEGRAVTGTPSVGVIHQSVDYDAASIQALAARVAKNPPSFGRENAPPAASPSGGAAPAAPQPSQPSPATLGSASKAPAPRLAPLPCVQAALGSSSTPGLVQLIQARFEGSPAYIAVYLTSSNPGGPPDLITVWVVSTTGCALLNYTSTEVP